ncbi:MAG: HAD-IC family P-type ATPase, partial [Allorhizobium sp.]
MKEKRHRAEKALAAIRKMLAPRVALLRDGQRVTLPAAEVVPGDIVLIEAGDRVPADLRLTWTAQLAVQEAALTGESVPVAKAVVPVGAAAPLGDRASMAFAGTLVVAGQGRGVVVATALGTEIGHITGLLAGVEDLTTPLLRQMNQFARWLAAVVVTVAAAIFAFGVAYRGYSMDEMFKTVVGLAVAGIPEGLPAILTVTLAIGVQRMAARRAIIRRLPAVETLGSVSVICSDKTGTLTRNEMTLRRIVTAGADFDLTGTGYAPEGAVTAREGVAPPPLA